MNRTEATLKQQPITDNGFLPAFEAVMRQATKQNRERLAVLIKQGDFNVLLEDLVLYAHLNATTDYERGRRFSEINELKEGMRRHRGEELPGIVAGTRALERKGLIRVNWAIGGIKEKQPFTVMLTYQPEDFCSFLDDLDDAFSRATLNDLRRMEILFYDHPRLYRETIKLALLVHLIVEGDGPFTVPDLVETFNLDRKEGKAPIINALEYLKKEKLIDIQWTAPDEGIINVGRTRNIFNINEGGER